MLKTLLIIGRPNVGKSSLFNRLIGRPEALVHNRRGVTRDLRQATADWHGLTFRVCDSAGLEESLASPEASPTRTLLEAALTDADHVLLLLDGRKGVTTADEEIAFWLRRFDRPITIAVNKAESLPADRGHDAYRLGFGQPWLISALHRQGIDDLMTHLRPGLEPPPHPPDSPEGDGADPSTAPRRPLRLAILGRPNVGKSTIINGLLGYRRQLTGDEAGLTRDAIEVPWVSGTPGWSLIDTAGLKAHGQYRDSLDRATASNTWQAIARADAVALTVDATMPLTRGDLSIARDCAKHGKPMLLLVNKTDLCTDPNAIARRLSDEITTKMAQIRHLPVLLLSAISGASISKIHPLAAQQARRSATRIGTGKLNRWLEGIVAANPLPLIRGRRMRIKYITQTDQTPPAFTLFTSHKAALPPDYVRYLTNRLIDDFDLAGIPIRLEAKRGDNPFENTTPHPRGRAKHKPLRDRLPRAARTKPRTSTKGEKPLSLKQRARHNLAGHPRRPPRSKTTTPKKSLQ